MCQKQGNKYCCWWALSLLIINAQSCTVLQSDFIWEHCHKDYKWLSAWKLVCIALKFLWELAIYPSDNCRVLSWTSYCNFLLNFLQHDKPTPMNNLLELATQFSSEVFVSSGGSSKFNNKLGAKNLIALTVSGISVLIAMEITIWPFRAKCSWTENPHHIVVKTKQYICVLISKAHLLLYPSYHLCLCVCVCARTLILWCLKYFYCARKLDWVNLCLHCSDGRFRMCSGLQLCSKVRMLWVSHQSSTSF